MQQQDKAHLKECAMQLLLNVWRSEIGSCESINPVNYAY